MTCISHVCAHGERKENWLQYVDDMLIIRNDEKKLEEIKGNLNRVFQIKDLGEPKNFIGMTIGRNKEEK